jgi:hypothetical protein
MATHPPRSANLAPILVAIRELETTEQLMVMQSLISLLRQKTERHRARRQVTEFRGIGKIAWQSVDIDQYLRLERGSWES